MALWWPYTLAIVAGIAFVIQYCWARRRLYKLASELPGPPAFPIIGNAWRFVGKTKDILNAIEDVTRNYPKPLRFWLGPNLVIYFTNPSHIEKILTAKNLLYKHEVYDYIKNFLGEGLISGSGEQWKVNRKIIQPMFNTRFINGCTKLFEKHMDICIKNLQQHVDCGTFDIHDVIHTCYIDIIGESILGTNINAQHGMNRDFIDATITAYDECYKRIVKPWYQSDLIYTISGNMKIQNGIKQELNKFLRKVLDESRARLRLEKSRDGEVNNNCNSPILDQIGVAYKRDSIHLEDQDYFDHILTLFLASEDTMSIITSFLCLILGMYPQYQEIAASEIRQVFGDKPRPVTYEDINKLPYLEMCMKDVLRLLPIAPFIIRQTTEDFHIDNLTIPKGCAILVAIFELHRDRTQWERPSQFYPDHFLPEACSKRHPYAFIPFSAGPRGCIGKQLAMTAAKMLLANILQRFEISADGKITDVKLKADISVRPQDGYKVRLKKRVWK